MTELTPEEQAIVNEVVDPYIEATTEEEIPPEPDEVPVLADLPLAEREAHKLAAMSPEAKERYDDANAELMANPTVAAFSEEEERRRAAKAATQAAFLAAYRKKQKEKT